MDDVLRQAQGLPPNQIRELINRLQPLAAKQDNTTLEQRMYEALAVAMLKHLAIKAPPAAVFRSSSTFVTFRAKFNMIEHWLSQAERSVQDRTRFILFLEQVCDIYVLALKERATVPIGLYQCCVRLDSLPSALDQALPFQSLARMIDLLSIKPLPAFEQGKSYEGPKRL